VVQPAAHSVRRDTLPQLQPRDGDAGTQGAIHPSPTRANFGSSISIEHPEPYLPYRNL